MSRSPSANCLSIEALVRAAFFGLPRPDDCELFEADSEGAFLYLRDRTWAEVSTVDANYHASVLPAFSPAGFRYFLPAFMLAALELKDAGVVDCVIDSVSPPKGDPMRPSFARRWQALSQEQKRVVIAFLRHFEYRNPLAIAGTVTALKGTIGD